MKYLYPACFYKEANGQYSVIFPDLEIATCGENLENALFMAEDLLCMYTLDCERNNEKLPLANSIGNVKFDDEIECTEKFVNIVVADLESYKNKNKKSVKKTLSIPFWLNQLAEDEGVNFSQILQKALKEQLNVTDK